MKMLFYSLLNWRYLQAPRGALMQGAKTSWANSARCGRCSQQAPDRARRPSESRLGSTTHSWKLTRGVHSHLATVGLLAPCVADI